MFVCGKGRRERQIPQPLHHIMFRLGVERVGDPLPEHLIAAADPKERRPRRDARTDRICEAHLSDVEEILRRILRARQEDEIRMPQFLGCAHIVERDIRLVCQRVKVRKVREFRRANDRNAQLSIEGGRIAVVLLVEGDGVLLVDAERVDVRDDPEDRLSRLLLQKVKGGREEAHITAKFVDDKPLDKRTLLRVEQFQCPHERGERTAAVDVGDQEDGRTEMLCHAHIDDIICL